MIANQKKKYSYQDCWNYAISSVEEIEIEKVKNDIVSLCRTSPENFWLSFSQKLLVASDYSLICHSLNRHLKENYPIPYLTNKVNFCGVSFYIERGVFIPQKDTEILVKKTLEIADKHWKGEKRLKVLDIGTGCGNIVVAMAKSKPNWDFVAVDSSEKALNVAKINVEVCQVKNIELIQSNLFNNIEVNKKFNIIVSNPPYVSEEEYESLSHLTKKQPKEALVAENNGYFFYQEIFSKVQVFLTKKFLLVAEIGQEQEKGIIKLVIDYFPQAKVSIFPDYQGHSRVIAIYQS
jgi:release factor glutamine methyltransferase